MEIRKEARISEMILNGLRSIGVERWMAHPKQRSEKIDRRLEKKVGRTEDRGKYFSGKVGTSEVSILTCHPEGVTKLNFSKVPHVSGHKTNSFEDLLDREAGLRLGESPDIHLQVNKDVFDPFILGEAGHSMGHSHGQQVNVDGSGSQDGNLVGLV